MPIEVQMNGLPHLAHLRSTTLFGLSSVMLIFDDDIQFRQETTALFIQAQAQLGLGQRVKARQLLQTVLRRDPNHALAADLWAEISAKK